MSNDTGPSNDPRFFSICFDRLLGNEGGYSNDPADPGGETNWGISRRSYPNLDIRGLSRDAAKTIYFADFWTPLGGNALPQSVAFQLFDFAVNSGIGVATRYFQRALGVADDGHFGPVSLQATKEVSEADMIFRLLAERLDFMTRCANWKDAGKGWARRIANDMRLAATDTPD